MTETTLIVTSTGSHEEAQRIARTLIERRLAACVNIIPGIESIYRWQETIEQSEEWLLFIKTTTANFAAVRDAIKELHSYELPECISVEIKAGSPEYLKWISESCEQP